jgi:predicted RNA-binding Zn-ribbon protein involved in translation (DUF1610 family)
MTASCSRPILRVLLIAVAVLVVAYPVAAGVGYTVKCAKCGLEANLFYDSGRASETVAVGYCCKCGKFVRVWYNRTKVTDDERKKLETPLGEIFCVESGVRYKIYACPDCGGPFAAIDKEAFGKPGHPEPVYCPECGEKSLTGDANIRWD